VAETLAGATERWISAATVVELGIVSLSRSGGKVGAQTSCSMLDSMSGPSTRSTPHSRSGPGAASAGATTRRG